MFLDKYIEENGKLTDYKIFKDGISGSINISVNDLFLAQYNNNNIYNAMDVIVKLLAIENYYGINDFGFDLYNKTQLKRVGEIWENRFKSLIRSVEQNGLLDIHTIDTDINYSIHDGAHRLALSIYHNIDNINVEVFNTELLRRKYGIEWFKQANFSYEEIEIINKKFEDVLAIINKPYYCIFWPPARNIFGKLEKELVGVENGIIIDNKEIIFIPSDKFKKFIYDIYSTDDIEKSKLDLKYQHLINSLETDNYNEKYLPIEVITVKLDNPDFKMKGLTGLPQSKKTMRIKKQIRSNNEDAITNYYYDIIMHMTDNTIQNNDVQKILKKVKK